MPKRTVRRGRPGGPGDAVLITGASTGLGLATALELAAAGFRVFASVRSADSRAAVEQAARERDLPIETLQLDLTDPAQITVAVQQVVETAGGLYALVNNGGIGLRGCLEDCSDEEIATLFQTNVLGTMTVTRAVLPTMRAAGCGRIVTVSSVAGRVSGWGVTMYGATKWAQEGFGEGMAQELAPFGIQSILVEPGIIKTERWQEHRGTAARADDRSSPYHDLFWASEAIADKIVERSPTRPADVGETIVAALTAEDPKLRYVVGRGAKVVIALRRHLPQGLFERLYYGGHIRRLERRAGVPAAAAARRASARSRMPDEPARPVHAVAVHRPPAATDRDRDGAA
jgi:NAD(P)-dependent dehydrogenase (short-subunit alcohol dehydrogenase family)